MLFRKNYEDLVSPFVQTKALAHRDRLETIRKGEIPAPVTLEVDLADGFCNNKCPHCFFGTSIHQTPVFIRTEALLDTIRHLAAKGLKGVELVGGGEPTTHPDFAEIVETIAALGIDLGLVTNGHLLKKYKDVLHHFNYIRISLDAATPEVYRITHGVDMFDSLMMSVREILDGGFYDSQKLGLGFLVMPNNHKDVEASAQIAVDLNLRFAQYRPASIKNNFTPEEALTVEARIHRLQEKYRKSDTQIFTVKNSWRHIIQKRFLNECKASCIMMVLQANGNIPLCILKRNQKEYLLGNIYEQSIDEIWFSQKHSDMINGINSQECPIPCKVDSYNIMLRAIEEDCLNVNFL